MSKLNSALLKSKFRGCINGILIGDCFGAPFSGDTFASSSKIVLQRYFDKLSGPYFKAPVKKCTKDAILTKCVAQTLIDSPTTFEPSNLAKRFVKEYFTDPRRGYSQGITDVFHQMRANKFSEPFKPATEHLDSSDNGAALRAAPIALLHHGDFEKMLTVAKQSTELTHTHKHGVTGALLHCMAVQQGLQTDPAVKIHPLQFLTEIIAKLKKIETDEEGLGIGNPAPFTTQMNVVRELLSNTSETTDEQVVDQLGHTTLAIFSVPTAIYCFLRAQTDIENIQTSNPFRRTVQYAISLGGDTSTIAGMAGSIAGAYYGDEQIGKTMLQHCEHNELFNELAEQLFTVKK